MVSIPALRRNILLFTEGKYFLECPDSTPDTHRLP